MMTAVLVQNDADISEPWMEFLFTRSWEYPQALSGLGDNIVTGTDRDGGTTIGSFMYAQGGATRTMELLERYIRFGGKKKYDITDPRQYPSVRQKPYLILEGNAAGRVNPGIGDVGGIAEYYGRMSNLGRARESMAAGWRWFRDPRFAWELVHTFGSKDPALIEAAKRCPRDPYLMNRSRVLSNWSGYLRLGAPHDDWRFQRAAAVRVGTGWGHAHQDTLDLRLFAFGLTMASDFNQRPAYGWPAHWRTLCHNLALVDRKNWMGHAWVRNLFDAPGMPYLAAESVAPYGMENVTLSRRQVALVDVDPGKPSPRGLQGADAVMPAQYVWDVYRLSGGKVHTYAFHGCADDGFEVNVRDKRPPTQSADSPDEGFLRPFRWWVNPDAVGGGAIGGLALKEPPKYWIARCDGRDLVATWRLDRRAEETMLRGSVPTKERKYVRLVLLDQAESKIMHAIARVAGGKGYYGRCLYAESKSEADTDRVFVALLEPYAGEPAIVSWRERGVADNEADARRAVAVEVKTRNGRTDLLFADGRPEKARRIEGGVEAAAECAYLSRDAGGLRQATVIGGTLLRSAEVTVQVQRPRYGGRVVNVDYLERKVTVAGAIPARLAGMFFEVGNPTHRTSYQISAIAPAGDGSVLTTRKGLEIMRTRIRSADPATGKVVGAIAMFRHRGRDAGLVASDDGLKKFWRVAYAGGDRHQGHTFVLTPMDPKAKGPAFTRADFPAGAGLRVWEFGPGDEIGIRTGVSLRRVARTGRPGPLSARPPPRGA